MQSAILEEMTREAQGRHIMQPRNYRTYDIYTVYFGVAIVLAQPMVI